MLNFLISSILGSAFTVANYTSQDLNKLNHKSAKQMYFYYCTIETAPKDFANSIQNGKKALTAVGAIAYGCYLYDFVSYLCNHC